MASARCSKHVAKHMQRYNTDNMQSPASADAPQSSLCIRMQCCFSANVNWQHNKYKQVELGSIKTTRYIRFVSLTNTNTLQLCVNLFLPILFTLNLFMCNNQYLQLLPSRLPSTQWPAFLSLIFLEEASLPRLVSPAPSAEQVHAHTRLQKRIVYSLK